MQSLRLAQAILRLLKGLPLHLPNEHEPEPFLTVLAAKDCRRQHPKIKL
jgi:hypothetical protein